MSLGELLSEWGGLLGGAVGLSLLYVAVMLALAIMRHKRERRMELRQMRIERMQRDMWLSWLRRRD